MNNKLKLPAALVPYSGVIYFVVILMVSHFVWKLTVLGDESDLVVTFAGYDISAPFNFMASHVARATYSCLHFIGSDIRLEPWNVLRYPNDVAVRIVWSCTALKQAYIFICIIAFYKGPFLKKMWFIPAGLIVVYAFNIFRISAITFLIEKHPDWFGFLHEHLFKYMYYAVIFGMWVYWEERVCKKNVVAKR